MNLSETARLLGIVAAFDRRTVGDADVIAWQSVLADISFEDAQAAAKSWYAQETDWMMPAHVRRGAETLRKARDAAAQATPWAPGQYGVLKGAALPEVTGPVDENALTPSVRALLDSVRAMLPEGSREALMPRRVAWEQEHQAYVRTHDAAPNPLYRPTTQCPGGLAARQDWDHAGVLRHRDGSFCGHEPEDPGSFTCNACGAELTPHGLHPDGNTRCDLSPGA